MKKEYRRRREWSKIEEEFLKGIRNRLFKFINADLDNLETANPETRLFIETFRIGGKKHWTPKKSRLKREQRQLKYYIDKLAKNEELNEYDWKVINDKRKTLSPYTVFYPFRNHDYPRQALRALDDDLSLLYQVVAKLASDKNPIKTCNECGILFLPNKNVGLAEHYFCSNQCQNKFHSKLYRQRHSSDFKKKQRILMRKRRSEGIA